MKIERIIEAVRTKRIRITEHADEEAQADKLKYEEIYFSVMKPFNKCPVCGNDLIEKDVEKILCGGKHAAVVTVRAEVCLHCGERLYSEEQARLFEQIRIKLAKNQTQDYEHMGKSYYVPLS